MDHSKHMMDHSEHVMEGGVMTMSGIPSWMFFLGIALILLFSFVMVEVFKQGEKQKKSYSKYDLLRFSWVSAFVKRPYFKFLFQFPIFCAFCFLIYAGIFGHGLINITPVATWTIWWAGLIFFILFFGKAWCFVCPWDFVAGLFQNMKPFGATKLPFTLGLKWPKVLSNIYMAAGMFVVLTWFELGFKITSSPRQTAICAIVAVTLATVSALLFEKRSFCKYVCMIGRIQGLYALFAPVEIRSRNLSVCATCKTKDCYSGNEKGNACPTSLTIPQITKNSYCILCTECLKTCPNDNIAINLRPFATDLNRFRSVKMDEACLALILLTLTSFHGLTMTPLWDAPSGSSVTGYLQSLFHINPLEAFTVGMLGFNGILIAVYVLVVFATVYFSGDKTVSFKKVFLFYAYSLLPVALFYHLAHNAMHLFMEGQVLVPLLSDPLGQGKNYFGTATWTLGPLLSANTIWLVQVGLVVVGHVMGIVVAHSVSRKLYKDKKTATRSLIPMLLVMIAYSCLSLWIMHLDMNMRSSLM